MHCNFKWESIHVYIPSCKDFLNISFDLENIKDETKVNLSGGIEIESLIGNIVLDSDDYDCDIYSFWSSCKYKDIEKIFNLIGGFHPFNINIFLYTQDNQTIQELNFLDDMCDFFNFVDKSLSNLKQLYKNAFNKLKI